jgi:cytochrome c-type biogenesis protein CcmH
MLWFTAGGLVALALAFAAWPFIRQARAREPGRAVSGDRGAAMRALYRDRVAEIEREAGAGQLDPELRREVEEELGANLLDEFRQAEATPAGRDSAPRPGPRLALWATVAALPLLAALVYLSVGEPDATDLAGASEVLRLDPAEDRVALERWRDRLARRVARTPGDGQSWYLLGVARLQLGDFAPAAEAFASASARVGNDPGIDIYWLQARYLADGGSLDAESRAIAARVLESRPNHPLVLEMYAIDAFRAGDYRQSVAYLNRALGNDLSAPQAEALLAGLAQARSRMEPLTPSVEVAVRAGDGVQPQAIGSPRATVFVIARPPGGGMPYAVVRRPARLLPLAVTLDDTVSMSPARPLSGADAFEVVVRLSRSGTAAPAPGDWEWRSDVLRTAELGAGAELEAALAPPATGG